MKGLKACIDQRGGLGKDEDMGHQGWSSKVAGPAIGPYRQATEAGGFVFLSGQLALDEQGNLISGSVAEQTRKVLERAQSLLREGGLTLGDVVKATVFLTDLKTFPEMNAVYAEYFPKDPPSRSTIQVAALPKGGAVEIELLARRVGS
jgi:2-iminobutanoate/2-iminopropanoate deaminase